MQVKKRDGTLEGADRRKISRCVERCCRGLDGVDAALVTDEAYRQLYDGITTAEIDRAAALAARARIASEPNYSYAAARLLLHSLYREAFDRPVDGRRLAADYRNAFVLNALELVHAGVLDHRLSDDFNLPRLAAALRPERDLLLKYLGVQTLHDRYLLRAGDRRLETPQAFWMRVAMGVSLGAADPDAAALDAYELFSTLLYVPATPTLFNAGTTRPQLASCYLSTVEDSIDGIYGTLHEQARLSKYAGGLGVDITPLRAAGSAIGDAPGACQGVIPWARQFNDLAVAVNQKGKRKGALCLYLSAWHLDYPDFLDLRRNTGDERRRCHDVNTASWIPDLFMKRVREGGDWYLFSPDDCPDLHDAWGDEFERLYDEYSRLARLGELENFRVLPARDLWKKMLTAIRETGHPWMTWKDPSNFRYANQHAGVVHSSNLCTEILEHTAATRWREQEVLETGETANCILGSVNAAAHADAAGGVDWAKLAGTVRRAVGVLDRVIDLNYYPTATARKSNLANRPLGLGLMGWQDLLHKQKLAFDAPDATGLAGRLQEFIAYHAILASTALAATRGRYPNYDGSLWSRGVLPQDTWAALASHRAGVAADPDSRDAGGTLPWEKVRQAVREHGMRNGLLTAIAPNATIASIAGCSQGIGPDYAALCVYSNLSGEFTEFNGFLVDELKARGLWGPDVATRLQQADGDVTRLDLPADLKARFKTAFDVDQVALVDAAAARQKWLSQAQSLNLYYKGDSMRGLSDLYFHAWDSLLPTTYYLHTKAASRVEQSTVAAAPEARAAAACVPGVACEACQ